jgi:hypothetical protein
MLAVDADSVLQAPREICVELAKGEYGQPICFSSEVLQEALLRTRTVELLDFGGPFLRGQLSQVRFLTARLNEVGKYHATQRTAEDVRVTPPQIPIRVLSRVIRGHETTIEFDDQAIGHFQARKSAKAFR